MNVFGGNKLFLLNKGGIENDKPGLNLNYGLFISNGNKINVGFETFTGEDHILTSQGPYNDGMWHNAILTFDDQQHTLKLYIDGHEIARKTTNIGITPDNTEKQTLRLGANSLVSLEKINGNYIGQLHDIQVWDHAFTPEQVTSLFSTESKIAK